jgi:hypothetical protein
MYLELNQEDAENIISHPDIYPFVRDAVLELSDVVATVIRDLKDKGILGI